MTKTHDYWSEPGVTSENKTCLHPNHPPHLHPNLEFVHHVQNLNNHHHHQYILKKEEKQETRRKKKKKNIQCKNNESFGFAPRTSQRIASKILSYVGNFLGSLLFAGLSVNNMISLFL